MKISLGLGILLLSAAVGLSPAVFAQEKTDNDHTLQAMRDEMARAKARLELKFTGTDETLRHYYPAYRLLDLDVPEIVDVFGALMSSTHSRSRFRDVEVLVGDDM